MKWITVHTNSSTDNFELLEDEKVLAGISFSRQTRFARLVSDLEKRMFSFEKRGFLKAKKVIRNEYGIRLGKLEELKPGGEEGIVELNGKKYLYSFDKDKSGELVLYDESGKKNLLTCSFNALNLGINKTKSLLDTRFASLLLVLCWYAFQPHSSSSARVL